MRIGSVEPVVNDLKVLWQHRQSLGDGVKAVAAILQGFEVCLELKLEDRVSIPLLSMRVV